MLLVKRGTENKISKPKKSKYYYPWFVVIGTLIMLATVAAYLLVAQTVLSSNRNEKDFEVIDFNSDWKLIGKDGTKTAINLPYTVRHINKEETLEITHEANDKIRSCQSMMIWNKGQVFDLYLDDELWYSYTEDSEHNIGLDRNFYFIFIDMPQTDYKEIKMTFKTVNATDKGKIGDVYFGNHLSLLMKGVVEYQEEIVLALFALFVGLVAIIIGLYLKITMPELESLLYAGMSVWVTSAWILANSRARQFLFSNAISIRDCAFFCVTLLPVVYSMYIDSIQQRRYHKIYLVLEHLGIVMFAILFVFHFGRIRNVSALNPISLCICVLVVIAFLVTSFLDAKKGKIKRYIMAAMGLYGFGIMGLVQMVMYQIIGATVTSGTYMSIGLLVLTVFSVINAIKGIGNVYEERREAVDQVKRLSISTMEALAKTVDAKDRYTAGHSFRVTEYASKLARALKWPDEEVHAIEFEGLLHDLGKIGIPDTVLNKPDKLSEVEYRVIKSHTSIGSDILRNITLMPGAENVARYHHERWDGKGYPEGLSGENIPIHARVVGIADAYDAMNSDRIYRKALPRDVIRRELEKGKGTQFDPDMVDVFIGLLDAGELDKKAEFESSRVDDIDIESLKEDVRNVIDSIDAKDEYEGALNVEYEEFAHLVGYMRNLEKRYHHTFKMVMISVLPKDGSRITEHNYAEAITSMDMAIRKTIRNIDICTKYNQSQFLCILLEVGNNENLDRVVQRIFLDFYKLFDGRAFDVSYEIIEK